MQENNVRTVRIRTSAPIVTYVYIALCAVVFLADSLTAILGYGSGNTGYLSVMGMRINPLITMGQWWRLVTPMFLHGGFPHILMNCYALYVWGRYAETFYGKIRFISILLVSGIMGCAAGYAFSSYNALGASGAVFGIFGAFLAFGKSHKQMYDRIFGMQIIVYVLFNLASGFLTEGIDNLGHIGGLVGGYLSGLALGMVWENRFTPAQCLICGVCSAVLGGVLAYFAGYVLVVPGDEGLTWMLTDYRNVFGVLLSFASVILSAFLCRLIMGFLLRHRMQWYQILAGPVCALLILILLFCGYVNNFHYLLS